MYKVVYNVVNYFHQVDPILHDGRFLPEKVEDMGDIKSRGMVNEGN